jgi:hypothetical protein
MWFGGLNGDPFVDESDYDYGAYAEGPHWRNRTPSVPRNNITCNRCGFRGLHWTNTESGWKLAYDSGIRTPNGTYLFGKIHACDFEGEDVAKKKVNHFNTLMDVINDDGFEYAFESYSNWEEIKDEQFHTLRLNFLHAMQELSDYVDGHADDGYED